MDNKTPSFLCLCICEGGEVGSGERGGGKCGIEEEVPLGDFCMASLPPSELEHLKPASVPGPFP